MLLELAAAKPSKDSGVDPALVVAIASAGFTGGAFVVGAASLLRNRPLIQVQYLHPMWRRQENDWVLIGLKMYVANVGRQAVALIDVGLCHSTGLEGRLARVRHKDGKDPKLIALHYAADPPRMLVPGAMADFDLPAPQDSFWHGGGVFAYAKDARRRVTYRDRKLARPAEPPPPQGATSQGQGRQGTPRSPGPRP